MKEETSSVAISPEELWSDPKFEVHLLREAHLEHVPETRRLLEEVIGRLGVGVSGPVDSLKDEVREMICKLAECHFYVCEVEAAVRPEASESRKGVEE